MTKLTRSTQPPMTRDEINKAIDTIILKEATIKQAEKMARMTDTLIRVCEIDHPEGKRIVLSTEIPNTYSYRLLGSVNPNGYWK